MWALSAGASKAEGFLRGDGDPDGALTRPWANKNEKYDVTVNEDGVLEGEIKVGCKIYTESCDAVFAQFEKINESESINIKFSRKSIYTDTSDLALVFEFGQSQKYNGYFPRVPVVACLA